MCFLVLYRYYKLSFLSVLQRVYLNKYNDGDCCRNLVPKMVTDFAGSGFS